MKIIDSRSRRHVFGRFYDVFYDLCIIHAVKWFFFSSEVFLSSPHTDAICARQFSLADVMYMRFILADALMHQTLTSRRCGGARQRHKQIVIETFRIKTTQLHCARETLKFSANVSIAELNRIPRNSISVATPRPEKLKVER